MSKPKVILTEHLDDEAIVWLGERVQLQRVPHNDEATLWQALAETEGLVIRTYTQVNQRLLDAAPRLKVVGRAGVGLDNVDLAACEARGVKVVYTPDANTQAVVEYVWALLFDALRPRKSLTETDRPEDFHGYRKSLFGRQLDTMTLGILGMGRIGRRIAEVARAFGLRVQYNDLLSHEALGLSPSTADEAVDKATLYQTSDILTIHTDGRSGNHHLLDAAAFAQLPLHCTLVNAARGMLVDHEALCVWAKKAESHGGRAILDVHDPEPPPADAPMWNHPNIRMLPHLASRTREALAAMSWVVKDVVRVLEEKEPRYPADSSSFF